MTDVDTTLPLSGDAQQAMEEAASTATTAAMATIEEGRRLVRMLTTDDNGTANEDSVSALRRRAGVRTPRALPPSMPLLCCRI